MREILFRAKAINREKGYHRTNYKNGDWVYGLVTRLYDDRFELPAEMKDINGVSGIEIDHNTISQYIGLCDKNGKKIFENDIVHVSYTDGMDECNELVEVTYTKHGYSPWSWEYSCDGCDLYCELLSVEVIGNKFDNPNLLEGGN